MVAADKAGAMVAVAQTCVRHLKRDVCFFCASSVSRRKKRTIGQKSRVGRRKMALRVQPVPVPPRRYPLVVLPEKGRE